MKTYALAVVLHLRAPQAQPQARSAAFFRSPAYRPPDSLTSAGRLSLPLTVRLLRNRTRVAADF